MPQVNPFDAYSDPTNPEMRRRLRVCYGALENHSDHAVRINVSFGEVDGSLDNNIALTFLEGTLVDAKVLVPKCGVDKVDIPDNDNTDPTVPDIPSDRRQFLPRPAEDVYAGPSYHIGQRFRINRDVYLLCQSAPFMLTLVSLTGGNRWTEGAVARDPDRVTSAEFIRIVNGYADPVLVEE